MKSLLVAVALVACSPQAVAQDAPANTSELAPPPFPIDGPPACTLCAHLSSCGPMPSPPGWVVNFMEGFACLQNVYWVGIVKYIDRMESWRACMGL